MYYSEYLNNQSLYNSTISTCYEIKRAVEKLGQSTEVIDQAEKTTRLICLNLLIPFDITNRFYYLLNIAY